MGNEEPTAEQIASQHWRILDSVVNSLKLTEEEKNQILEQASDCIMANYYAASEELQKKINEVIDGFKNQINQE